MNNSIATSRTSLLLLLVTLPLTILAEEKLLYVFDLVKHGSKTPKFQDNINATGVYYP